MTLASLKLTNPALKGFLDFKSAVPAPFTFERQRGRSWSQCLVMSQTGAVMVLPLEGS